MPSAPFQSLTNKNLEFNVHVIHNEEGYAYVYVNDILAFKHNIGKNNGGGMGLVAGCNAAYHNVQVRCEMNYPN